MNDSALLYLFTAYLSGVLLVCTLVDIRRYVIPNLASGASLTGAVAFAVMSSHHALMPQILGGVLGGGGFMALAIAFHRIRHHEGLGLGDAKFMLGAGTWVGWQGVAPLVLLASVSALIYLLTRKVIDPRFNLQGRVPFAPFLSATTLFIWSLQEFGTAIWME
ncbi:prepilin peptidase [Microvirga sp. G4-2]|uniref:prepilin peptidase n=1 Tax=Microvirga sp. G4-2 TaxID=3434467 RepID=UPI004043D539